MESPRELRRSIADFLCYFKLNYWKLRYILFTLTEVKEWFDDRLFYGRETNINVFKRFYEMKFGIIMEIIDIWKP